MGLEPKHTMVKVNYLISQLIRLDKIATLPDWLISEVVSDAYEVQHMFEDEPEEDEIQDVMTGYINDCVECGLDFIEFLSDFGRMYEVQLEHPVLKSAYAELPMCKLREVVERVSSSYNYLIAGYEFTEEGCLLLDVRAFTHYMDYYEFASVVIRYILAVDNARKEEHYGSIRDKGHNK